MEVKASQRRLSSSKKSTYEWVIELNPYISLKFKREFIAFNLKNMTSCYSFYGKINEIILQTSIYFTVGYTTV